MSVAMVLLGWIAASLLLSPLVGRFIAAQDDHQDRSPVPSRTPAIAPLPQGANANIRRNAAIQLSGRDAGWPRVG